MDSLKPMRRLDPALLSEARPVMSGRDWSSFAVSVVVFGVAVWLLPSWACLTVSVALFGVWGTILVVRTRSRRAVVGERS